MKKDVVISSEKYRKVLSCHFIEENVLQNAESGLEYLRPGQGKGQGK